MKTDYVSKKRFYDSLLTIYGRNPVLEALQNRSIDFYRIHLSSSNKRAAVLEQIEKVAKSRGIEIVYHEKAALSRISKNSKQDQGVAADIILSSFKDPGTFIKESRDGYSLIALDGINNPQNLGMIIRSVTASPINAIILPSVGSAKLSPLTIKASSGTLFKATIVNTKRVLDALSKFRDDGAEIVILSSRAKESLFKYEAPKKVIYVLGNESEGVSREVATLGSRELSIEMKNGVESLNVAVTAALIAFKGV